MSRLIGTAHEPCARRRPRRAAAAPRGGPRPRAVRAADGHPRHDRRERRAAEHRAGPALLGHQPVLGAQRLRADVRRPAAARRPGRATSSAGAGCSSPASPCSRWPRWPAAWPPQPGLLLAARAVQGVGGAIASPAVLALIVSAFPEGRERNRALGLYAAMAIGGASLGLVLGGRDHPVGSPGAGCFFINVPIGIAGRGLHPALPDRDAAPAGPLRPGRRAHLDHRHGRAGLRVHPGRQRRLVGPDDAGRAGRWRWPLLAAFVLTETRAAQPITPLRLFADRQRSASYAARLLLVGGMFGMFFFATQYLQADPGLQPGAGRPGVPAHDGPAVRRVPAGRRGCSGGSRRSR